MILVIALLNTMYHFLMGPYKAKHQTQYRYDKEYSRSKMLSSMGNICDMLLLIIKKIMQKKTTLDPQSYTVKVRSHSGSRKWADFCLQNFVRKQMYIFRRKKQQSCSHKSHIKNKLPSVGHNVKFHGTNLNMSKMCLGKLFAFAKNSIAQITIEIKVIY